jgi:DNA processing protein
VAKPDQLALFAPAPLPTAVLDDAERLACLRLIRSDNVGPVTFRELINRYGGAARALAALPELQRRGGRGRSFKICTRSDAESELEAAARAGAQSVFTIEPGYPPALAAIEAPPPMLYVKGKAELLGQPGVAIVGSRQASAAGIKLARLFADSLSKEGFVIVSGLARGIDAAAHEASLARGTVAVLAGGIDIVYPPEHAGLQERIGAVGCLVTEQPPGFVPRAKEFPRRNRLVSGIALGVAVIEAAKRSGTLVTARFAGEQGREVFAVPGHPLDPRAEGTNQLLKNGATIATEPQDIISQLMPMITPPRPRGFRDILDEAEVAPIPPASFDVDESDRGRVLNLLGPHPVDIDEVVRATGLGVREVRVILMELDLAGEIERHGQQLVSRLARS